MKKKIENRGGPRPNSGAKKKGSAARVKVSFTLEPECKKLISILAEDLGISRSEWLNQLIRELME
jgi:hypothetical protein